MVLKADLKTMPFFLNSHASLSLALHLLVSQTSLSIKAADAIYFRLVIFLTCSCIQKGKEGKEGMKRSQEVQEGVDQYGEGFGGGYLA